MLLHETNTNTLQLGLGTWLSSGSPVVAELASECGFDWLLLDLEHGCLTESGLLQSLMAVKGSAARAIVRVGGIDPTLIGRLLDWGAAGVMLPHVSTPAKAAECLKAMNYPPHGTRGYTSSARSFAYGIRPPGDPGVHPKPLFLAQIEDEEGVKNAEAIAAVPGVDVLFVGPSDLQLNLSAFSATLDFQTALSKVSASANTHQKQAGILVRDNTHIPDLRKKGYSCLALGSDLGILRSGFQKMLPLQS